MVSMQRLQLLQKERHQKSIQLYWAEKSGTTRIQAKKYYRKAKLQEISRKSQNPIVEKKQEFQFNQSSGTAILASMYIKNHLRVKSRKRQDLILAVLLSRSQISFYDFYTSTLNKTIQAQSSTEESEIEPLSYLYPWDQCLPQQPPSP